MAVLSSVPRAEMARAVVARSVLGGITTRG